MSAPVTSQIDWHGVAISVSYHRHQWSTFDHIEVNVIGDGIIPITETGYRSHYLHSDVTDEYGGAVATCSRGLSTKLRPRNGKSAKRLRVSFHCSSECYRSRSGPS